MPLATVTLPGLPGKQVGKVGTGLMTLPASGSAEDDKVAFEAMLTAVKDGANLFNSATFYGPPNDPFANLRLVARFLAAYPEETKGVVLSVKGAFGHGSGPKSDINAVREELLEAKKILGDKAIDVFEMARTPTDIPTEQAIKQLITLQSEGLFTAISLSEASAKTITLAASLTTIAFVELEVNLWSTEPAIIEAINTASKLNIPIVGYSPHGAGFISGRIKSPADLTGFKGMLPKLQGENFNKNLELANKVKQVADRRGVTPGTIAIAWAMTVAPTVIALPGSSNPARVKENIAAGSYTLLPEDKAELDDFTKTFTVVGDRYPPGYQEQLMK